MQAKISKIESSDSVIIIKKFKNIRKFNKKCMFPSCMGGCCKNTLHGTTGRVITTSTTTKVMMMGRLRQQQHRGVNVVGVINRVLGAQNSQLIHWQLDSQARAVHGERSNYPAYDQATLAIQDQFSSYGGLPQGDNNSSSSHSGSYNSVVSSAHPVHQPSSEFAAVSHPLSGAFGESQWFDTITMENASPSPPPPLEPWPNYSMFMVATEPWPSGTSNRSATTGEQLNTPQPAAQQSAGDFGGFDFGSVFERSSSSSSEQRDAASQRRTAAKVNLTNVFSKNDIYGITKNSGEDSNNNYNYIRKGNDAPMEPLFSNHAESVITAGFDSWEFGPCPEETLLSPISYMATPHHSPGVASPGSSSGDTDSPNHQHHHQRRTSLQEFETCVDFNSVLLSPSSPIVEASEEDDLCAGNLHEEIEQLSNSFYCTSNSLVSVNNTVTPTTVINAGIDVVSPSILKLLQEQDQPQQPTNQPSVDANSYFSDATNDGEDEQHVERKTVEVVAAATSCYTADEPLVDVKTQTQLEHNYTIQLPSAEPAPVPAVKKQTTVKEATTLATTLAKTRETTLRPPQARPIAPSVKRQLFQRMKSRMDAMAAAAPAASPNRKVPNLKLKIINTTEARVVDESALMTTTQVVLNTPDLTENLLDLEDEFLIKEENFDLLKYIDSATGYDVIHSPQEEKPTVSFTEPAPAPSTSTSTAATTTICGPTLSDLFNPAKRRLPTITIENIDELTSSTNAATPKRFRSATSSATSSVCGDNGSEASTRPAKRRGRPPKPVASGIRDRSEYEHLSEADMRYREQRDKNNEASRKSRINRKDRESKLEQEASELVQKYEVLEGKERELIRECARWRRAVMRLALL